MKNEPRIAAGYCYVSKAARRSEESIKKQIKKLRRSVGKCPPGRIFIDDRTGSDRPELKRLMDEIEAGRIESVVVTELNRLADREEDFLRVYDFIRSHKVCFWRLSRF